MAVRLDRTLKCGQAFRWRAHQNQEWSCAFAHHTDIAPFVLTVRQNDERIEYKTTPSVGDAAELFLRDYLNVRVPLQKLYAEWSAVDSHFARKSVQYAGVRILRQDPWENLVSFICSSNNNIPRITQMLDRLCRTYGDFVASIDGVEYHAFPPAERLAAKAVDAELRALGFGYRAKFIQQTAQMVMDRGGRDWLMGLRGAPYAQVHAELCTLMGVGAKVADCVCLMSMDKTEAVPVDTHVWQIAVRDYKMRKLKGTSMTQASYLAVGDFFRKLWGEYAGWAHSVLFTADLRAFQAKEEDKTERITVETSVGKDAAPKAAKTEPGLDEHELASVLEDKGRRIVQTQENVELQLAHVVTPAQDVFVARRSKRRRI